MGVWGDGLDFSGGKYGEMGVYTIEDRACARASGWVGVRVRVPACACPDARDVCPSLRDARDACARKSLISA